MSLSSLLNLPSRGGFMRRDGAPSPSRAEEALPNESPPDSSSDPARTGEDDSYRQRHYQPSVGGTLRKYVCDHNSAPPAHQYITTDKTNILIRALTLKRSKDELAGRAASGAGASGVGHQRGASGAAGAAGGPGVGGGGGGAAGRSKGPAGVGAFAAGGGGGSGGGDAKGKRVASSSSVEPADTIGRGLGRHQASGLERAAKRPALDGSTAEYSRLEGLSVEELRTFLRNKGQTVGVDNAGRAALLARAKLSLRAAGGDR